MVDEFASAKLLLLPKMSVSEAIELLVAEHDRIGSPLRRYLHPGLAPSIVQKTLASLDLEPASALVELWSSYDGLDSELLNKEQPRTSLFIAANLWWAKLSDSVSYYQLNLEQSALSAPFLDWDTWLPEWFPLFSIGGSGWIAADLRTPGPHLVSVSFLDPLGPPVAVELTVEGYLIALVEQFREGHYIWEEGEGWSGLSYSHELGIELPGEG